MLLAGPISQVAYNDKPCIFDFLLIDLLLNFFPIWMCHFDSVVSLYVKLDSLACFPLVFWCHFEYKIVLYYF